METNIKNHPWYGDNGKRADLLASDGALDDRLDDAYHFGGQQERDRVLAWVETLPTDRPLAATDMIRVVHGINSGTDAPA